MALKLDDLNLKVGSKVLVRYNGRPSGCNSDEVIVKKVLRVQQLHVVGESRFSAVTVSLGAGTEALSLRQKVNDKGGGE